MWDLYGPSRHRTRPPELWHGLIYDQAIADQCVCYSFFFRAQYCRQVLKRQVVDSNRAGFAKLSRIIVRDKVMIFNRLVPGHRSPISAMTN